EDAKPIEAADLPDPFAFTLLAPDWDKIAPYFEQAIRIFPKLESAPIRRFVNGPESFTPDNAPLIGPIAGIRGIYVLTAMNSGGVTYSAYAGPLIADLIGETEPRFDAVPVEPRRFGEQARDKSWLKREISAVVSRGYRQSNLSTEKV